MFGVSDVNDWRTKKLFYSYGHYYAHNGYVYKEGGEAAHGRALLVGEVVRVICNRSAGTIEWWVKDEKLGDTFYCEKLKNKENGVRFSVTLHAIGDEIQIMDMN
jgi:catechol-2,3-dioxygenase